MSLWYKLWRCRKRRLNQISRSTIYGRVESLLAQIADSPPPIRAIFHGSAVGVRLRAPARIFPQCAFTIGGNQSMATGKKLTIQKALATLKSASTPIGVHLVKGRRLSSKEHDSIMNTVLGLQSSLEVWKRKNSMPPLLP